MGLYDLGAAGDTWATDLLRSSGEEVVPTASGGAFNGFSDSFGSVLNTAGNWLESYLDYQSKKDLAKYKLQGQRQQSILSAVEVDQRTGAVPYPANQSQFVVGGGASGVDNRLLLGLAVAAVAVLIIKI